MAMFLSLACPTLCISVHGHVPHTCLPHTVHTCTWSCLKEGFPSSVSTVHGKKSSVCARVSCPKSHQMLDMAGRCWNWAKAKERPLPHPVPSRSTGSLTILFASRLRVSSKGLCHFLALPLTVMGSRSLPSLSTSCSLLPALGSTKTPPSFSDY